MLEKLRLQAELLVLLEVVGGVGLWCGLVVGDECGDVVGLEDLADVLAVGDGCGEEFG